MPTSTLTNNKTDTKAIGSLTDLIDSLENVKDISFSDKIVLANTLMNLRDSKLKVFKNLSDTALLIFSNGVDKQSIETFNQLYKSIDAWVVDTKSMTHMKRSSVLGALTGQAFGKSPTQKQLDEAEASFYVD